MFAQDYLNLRSVCLASSEEWDCTGGGLVFVFVREGDANYASGPVMHQITSGDVLVLDAMSGGKLRVPNEGRMVFWHFSLCLEHLLPLFAVNEIYLLRDVSNVFKSARLYPASSVPAQKCRRLFREAPSQPGPDHRSQLLRVAAAILAVELKTAEPQQSEPVRSEGHSTEQFEKLSMAELLNSSVGELAIKFSCSRRHLNRLFHQHFGGSTATLKMEVRLLKAASLLRNSDTKIIRVAEECGFNQLNLFNTRFKMRFGASPRQWRKMVIQNPQADLDFRSASCPLRTNGLCPVYQEEPQTLRAGGEKVLPARKKSIPGRSITPLLCGMTTLNHPKVNTPAALETDLSTTVRITP